jgi:uncharacterized phage protein (TIGR02220 family)
MSRTLQIPEQFFKELATKDKMYARVWVYWITNNVNDIFIDGFVQEQEKKYPSITNIRDIYEFGIQFLDEFKIIEKKKSKTYSKDFNEVSKKVLDYLNDKAGSSFMHKKTNLDIISARMTEGFVYSDFIKVIDSKVKDWKGTDWEKYLRPITLFSKTKFENYLNGASKSTTTTDNKFAKFSESVAKAKEIIKFYKNE